MTVRYYRMTGGTLSLGSGPLQVAAQLTSCQVQVAESVKNDDAIPVLSGEEVPEEVADVTLTFTLSGKLLQDLTAAGVVDWAWDHDGLTEEAFVFSPSNATDRGVSGICYPIPITIGGDVKSKPQSDFTWRVKGTPVFGVFDPVDDTVTEDA